MADSPPPLPPKGTPPPLSDGSGQRHKGSGKGVIIAVLCVVFGGILLIGILASASMPVYKGIQERAVRTKAVNNVKQVVLGCRVYAFDYDGQYPTPADGEEWSSSQDAFNVLIPDYIDLESVFWMPSKLNKWPPTEDGVLEEGETVYGYTYGLDESSPSRAPLVFDGLMSEVGVMAEEHPYPRVMIMGYAGGQVVEESLTRGNGHMKEIFESVPPNQILLPLGY
ncbi:MAG: type II secretion system protein [Verrucomicrobiota bacterium]